MKTAISVPDDLFEAAEALARELGVSRSRLYSQAVAELVARQRQSRITERLDAVYSETEAEVDPVLEEMQLRSLHRHEG